VPVKADDATCSWNVLDTATIKLDPVHSKELTRLAEGEAKELTTVTIDKLYWPDQVRKLTEYDVGKNNDIFVSILESIPGRDVTALAEFAKRASQTFILRADGHPDVAVKLNGWSHSLGHLDDRAHDASLRAVGLTLPDNERKKMVSGVDYKILPVNNDGKYLWKVSRSVTLRLPQSP
jgi:hypothetical protein